MGEEREEIVTPSVLPDVSRKEGKEGGGQNCEQDLQRVRWSVALTQYFETRDVEDRAGVRNVCTADTVRA